MKKGWETKSIGEVCILKSGTTVTSSLEKAHGEMPYIKVADMSCEGNEDEIVTSSRFLNIVDAGRNAAFPAGTTIFPKRGGAILTNKKRLTAIPIFADLNIMGVIPSASILPRFLYYYFLTVDMRDLGNGSSIPQINNSDISPLVISFPNSAEQHRIVRILDEAFANIAIAKANAEKNLKNAKAIFESYLNEVFTKKGEGWVENKLMSITTKIGSGATPRGGEESYKTTGVSLIRSLNVHDLGFKYAKLAFIDNAQANELSNVEVQPRDVLLNITGASVARCTIVPEAILPARVNQHVSIIRPIPDRLDAGFLHYLLISKAYKDQLLKTGEEGGSTRQAITKAQIQDFAIEYPAAIAEQRSIVSECDIILAEAQRLANIYERKHAALEALKKSLLHQAFIGEL